MTMENVLVLYGLEWCGLQTMLRKTGSTFNANLINDNATLILFAY